MYNQKAVHIFLNIQRVKVINSLITFLGYTCTKRPESLSPIISFLEIKMGLHCKHLVTTNQSVNKFKLS